MIFRSTFLGITILLCSYNSFASNFTIKIKDNTYRVLSSDVNGDGRVDFYIKASPKIIPIAIDDDINTFIPMPTVSYLAISNGSSKYNVYYFTGNHSPVSGDWIEEKYTVAPTGDINSMTISPVSGTGPGPFGFIITESGGVFQSPTMPRPILEFVTVDQVYFPLTDVVFSLPPPSTIPKYKNEPYITQPSDPRH